MHPRLIIKNTSHHYYSYIFNFHNFTFKITPSLYKIPRTIFFSPFTQYWNASKALKEQNLEVINGRLFRVCDYPWSCETPRLTRSQSLPVGIFIANLKRGDWNEKKKWRRRGIIPFASTSSSRSNLPSSNLQKKYQQEETGNESDTARASMHAWLLIFQRKLNKKSKFNSILYSHYSFYR